MPPRERCACRWTPGNPFLETEAGHVCLAIRHGPPGEALLVARAWEEPRGLMRTYLWNRATFEGWGLFALAWALDEQRGETPFTGRRDLMRVSARMRCIEAARLLASLEVHAEGYTLEEAAQSFRRRSGLDLERALARGAPGPGGPAARNRHPRVTSELLRLHLEDDDPWRVLRLIPKNPHLRPRDAARAAG